MFSKVGGLGSGEKDVRILLGDDGPGVVALCNLDHAPGHAAQRFCCDIAQVLGQFAGVLPVDGLAVGGMPVVVDVVGEHRHGCMHGLYQRRVRAACGMSVDVGPGRCPQMLQPDLIVDGVHEFDVVHITVLVAQPLCVVRSSPVPDQNQVRLGCVAECLQDFGNMVFWLDSANAEKVAVRREPRVAEGLPGHRSVAGREGCRLVSTVGDQVALAPVRGGNVLADTLVIRDHRVAEPDCGPFGDAQDGACQPPPFLAFPFEPIHISDDAGLGPQQAHDGQQQATRDAQNQNGFGLGCRAPERDEVVGYGLPAIGVPFDVAQVGTAGALWAGMNVWVALASAEHLYRALVRQAPGQLFRQCLEAAVGCWQPHTAHDRQVIHVPTAHDWRAF